MKVSFSLVRDDGSIATVVAYKDIAFISYSKEHQNMVLGLSRGDNLTLTVSPDAAKPIIEGFRNFLDESVNV